MPTTVLTVELAADVSVEEENGEIVQATRGAIVRTTESPAIIEVLDHPSVPQPGEPLNESWAPDVRVDRRSVKFHGRGNDGAVFHLAVHYTLQRPEEDRALSLSGGASLQQITTQVDRDENPIIVSYNGDQVRAELDVLEVRSTFQRELREQVEDPDAVVDSWANHVNGDDFRGALPGRWLCVNVEYELIDRTTTPPTYLFRYTFERKPFYWKYTAAYKDGEGRIPPDVIEGNGLTTVFWHPSRSFTEKFE